MQRLRQLTFASLECDRKKRRMRHEIFPERMDARIAPTHPKGGRKGRQPHPLPAMLRVHCVKPFCNLSNPAMEDMLAMPRASGCLDGASPEKVPDEATIPTSAAGWSAADWRTCRSGDR